jgi:co-chaperonin GroES (HSP10)
MIKPLATAGGIFLGENEENTGEVIAVGPGKWGKNGKRETMWGLKPGDRVVFSPNGNFPVKVDGEELVMVRRDAIIGEVGEEVAA